MPDQPQHAVAGSDERRVREREREEVARHEAGAR